MNLRELQVGDRLRSLDFGVGTVSEVRSSGFVMDFEQDLMPPDEELEVRQHPDMPSFGLKHNQVFWPFWADAKAFIKV